MRRFVAPVHAYKHPALSANRVSNPVPQEGAVAGWGTPNWSAGRSGFGVSVACGPGLTTYRVDAANASVATNRIVATAAHMTTRFMA
jgi:hypothetical protein